MFSCEGALVFLEEVVNGHINEHCTPDLCFGRITSRARHYAHVMVNHLVCESHGILGDVFSFLETQFLHVKYLQSRYFKEPCFHKVVRKIK